jgi:exodeoxyribonuclease V alpha subunit
MYGLIASSMKISSNKSCESSCNFKKRVIASGIFSCIDMMFAEKLLLKENFYDEDALICLCYLFLISRNGHVCLFFDKTNFSPCLSEILLDEKNEVTTPSFYKELTESILRGKEILSQKFGVDNEAIYVKRQVIFFNDKLYLQRNWVFESLIILNLKRIILSSHDNKVIERNFCDLLQSLVKENKLLPSQAFAITRSYYNSMTVICGGPGTGKTYTASYLIYLYTEAIRESLEYKIMITAPTGRAASNLEEKIKQFVKIKPNISVDKATLHAVIGKFNNKKKYCSHASLPYDLYIIDEASMIDMKMMAQFLSSIKKGARIVFLGDPFQLPPVESGSVFADLSKNKDFMAKEIVVHLDQCLRFTDKNLHAFASSVKQGDTIRAMSVLNEKGDNPSISWHECEDKKNATDDIIDIAKTYYPMPQYDKFDVVKVMHKLSSFRILSSIRHGRHGCNALNHHICNSIHENIGIGQYWAVPIIITKNDYSLEVFNGTLGVVIGKKTNNKNSKNILSPHSEVYFVDESNKGYKSWPLFLLPSLEIAYCLSVHKSQGSEYNHVYLLLPDGSDVFGREVLYTAATRAKEKLNIASSQTTLEKTILKHSNRISGIFSRYTL